MKGWEKSEWRGRQAHWYAWGWRCSPRLRVWARFFNDEIPIRCDICMGYARVPFTAVVAQRIWGTLFGGATDGCPGNSAARCDDTHG